MSADLVTNSELFFKQLCDREGVMCKRLPATGTSKSPDFELSLGGNPVIVEVKQVEPNAEEIALQKAQASGSMLVSGGDPNVFAERLRNFIKTSRSQIRARRQTQPKAPAILVMFNNTSCRFYDDPMAVQVAMYGFEQVDVAVPASGDLVVVERGFGKRNDSTIRPDHNTHLSAVATLHQWWGENGEVDFELRIFHNGYAVIPLSPQLWRSSRVRNFRLGPKIKGQFQNWESA